MVTPVKNIIPQYASVRKKKKVLKPVKPSASDIVTYRKQLYAILDYYYEQVQTKIYPLLKTIPVKGVLDANKQDVLAELMTIQLTVNQLDYQAYSIALKTINTVAAHNAEKMKASFNAAFGVDLPGIINNEGLQPIIDRMTTENVNLIKSIPKQYLGRVEKSIKAGILNNEQAEDLTKTLSNDYDISQRRAKFIARDQISKINAAISQKRQQNLGIEKYVWSTSMDDRVRETHQEAEGNIYSYDSPPEVTDYNNPGEDYGCRCVASPVIEFD